MKSMSLALAVLFVTTGCATALAPEADGVRIVETKSEYNCNFVSTIGASDASGLGAEMQSENALNKLRNKAAKAGMNGVRIIHMGPAGSGVTVTAEGLRCSFDD